MAYFYFKMCKLVMQIGTFFDRYVLIICSKTGNFGELHLLLMKLCLLCRYLLVHEKNKVIDSLSLLPTMVEK